VLIGLHASSRARHGTSSETVEDWSVSLGIAQGRVIRALVRCQQGDSGIAHVVNATAARNLTYMGSEEVTGSDVVRQAVLAQRLVPPV
jgi:hypothetical protein